MLRFTMFFEDGLKWRQTDTPTETNTDRDRQTETHRPRQTDRVETDAPRPNPPSKGSDWIGIAKRLSPVNISSRLRERKWLVPGSASAGCCRAGWALMTHFSHVCLDVCMSVRMDGCLCLYVCVCFPCTLRGRLYVCVCLFSLYSARATSNGVWPSTVVQCSVVFSFILYISLSLSVLSSLFSLSSLLSPLSSLSLCLSLVYSTHRSQR